MGIMLGALVLALSMILYLIFVIIIIKLWTKLIEVLGLIKLFDSLESKFLKYFYKPSLNNQ